MCWVIFGWFFTDSPPAQYLVKSFAAMLSKTKKMKPQMKVARVPVEVFVAVALTLCRASRVDPATLVPIKAIAKTMAVIGDMVSLFVRRVDPVRVSFFLVVGWSCLVGLSDVICDFVMWVETKSEELKLALYGPRKLRIGSSHCLLIKSFRGVW
jgi:hypothetical protein